jgi:hypothetical protein
MNRHVEKLIHCDPRLRSLSQKNDITLENPFFESRCSIFEDLDDVKCHDFEIHKEDDDQFGPQRFRELLSHHSSSSRIDAEGRHESKKSESLPRHFSNSGEFQNYINIFFILFLNKMQWLLKIHFIPQQSAMVSQEKENCYFWSS